VNKIFFMSGLLSCLFLLFSTSLSKFAGSEAPAKAPSEKAWPRPLVLLLGASIGRGWNLSGLPGRSKTCEYRFEYLHGGSSFDKTARLLEVLSRQEDKPDAVILKECAAYFPGNLASYKGLMVKWVQACRDAGVIPIPATVVPVTRLHPFQKFLIDIVKGRNPFRFGNPFSGLRARSIFAYNDWLRSYAAEAGMVVLDLEAALRYGENNRFLRQDLAKLDGLHVNSKAYRILDRIVLETLDRVDWGGK